MKQLMFIVWIFLFGSNCFAQSTLRFEPVVGREHVHLEDTLLQSNRSEKYVIGQLKWYISGIELFENDSLVYAEANSFHLLDLAETNSLDRLLQNAPAGEYNRLRFRLGIDSTTNVSGAMGGDLDPMLGMYWTWQSGYINFKLEGTGTDSSGKTTSFQFHLGGYQQPFNSLRTIDLSVTPQAIHHIRMDLGKLFETIDLNHIQNIMSPAPNALTVADSLVTCFKIAP